MGYISCLNVVRNLQSNCGNPKYAWFNPHWGLLTRISEKNKPIIPSSHHHHHHPIIPLNMFILVITSHHHPNYTHTPKSLQCLRLTAIPNQNARHDPCPGTDLAKPLSPLEMLALTSLDQTIMVLLCSIRF
jgi:hypothetical protein